jgi:hypothetical protein
MAWNPQWALPWPGAWSGGAPASPATPAEGPVLPGFGFGFAQAIVATGLSITVVNLTTGATVSGTVSYNASTRLATWTAAAGAPLVRGVKYYVTVQGATAEDGTPMVPVSFPFRLNSGAAIKYFRGLGRPSGRLTA